MGLVLHREGEGVYRAGRVRDVGYTLFDGDGLMPIVRLYIGAETALAAGEKRISRIVLY